MCPDMVARNSWPIKGALKENRTRNTPVTFARTESLLATLNIEQPLSRNIIIAGRDCQDTQNRPQTPSRGLFVASPGTFKIQSLQDGPITQVLVRYQRGSRRRL